MSHRAEYPMLGLVLIEYRDAVQMIEGCLVTAKDICKTTDFEKAAAIESCRIAVMQALDVVDGLLAERPRKES